MYQKWLQAFHAVARTGGFTTAARQLNVGQPTISTHVRSLEDHFGIELFYRRGRVVKLTDTGRVLLTITQGMFGHEEEAINLLQSVRDLKAGSLRIGAIAPYDVMKLAADYRAYQPGIEISVMIGNTAEVLDGLLRFDFDIGIIGHELKDLRFFNLFYDRHDVLLLVHANHRLAMRRSVRIEEVDGEDMILRAEISMTRQVFERALAAANAAINPIMKINSREAVREAVLRGLGIGVISAWEYFPDPRIRALTFSNAQMFTASHLVCLAERKERPLIHNFLTMAQEQLSQQSTGKTERIARLKRRERTSVGSENVRSVGTPSRRPYSR
jgi:LysR family transcriptional regulator, low CO2-responsive transcriptional regulator